MKMNFNKIYILPIIALIGLLGSCKKSYLETYPYDGINLNIAITSEADLKVALNGMYSAMRSYTIYGRLLPAKGDIMSDNVYTSAANTGRQNNTYNLFNFQTTNTEASSIFGETSANGSTQVGLYAVIKRCNQIISSNLVASVNVSEYKGEAYAARALCYLELVRNFAYPYATNPNGLGVPIVTSFFSSNIKPARNTVAEVYAQINSDLNAAYSNMTVYTSNAYLSKYAARAIQARVYMDMADWVNAKIAALDVVTNGGFTLTPSTSYVAYWAGSNAASATKVEGIFSLICDASNNNGNESLSFLYYQGGAYGDYLVTNQLYSLYTANDVRKSLIAPAVRGGYSVLSSVKYPNSVSTSINKDNIPVLRYSETLLILAEAYYNTPDPTNALLYLNKVAKQRDPSFAGYTSTGTQILEDILTEKRKELAFEGSRYWDLYRLQRTYTKFIEQSLGQSMSITIPTTKGCRFPIPQLEIDANSNMIQNSEY